MHPYRAAVAAHGMYELNKRRQQERALAATQAADPVGWQAERRDHAAGGGWTAWYPASTVRATRYEAELIVARARRGDVHLPYPPEYRVAEVLA